MPVKDRPRWLTLLTVFRGLMAVGVGVFEILAHNALARWVVAIIAVLGIAFAFLFRRFRREDETELSILNPPRH